MSTDPEINDLEHRILMLEYHRKLEEDQREAKVEEDRIWHNGCMAGMWIATSVLFVIALGVVFIIKGCHP